MLERYYRRKEFPTMTSYAVAKSVFESAGNVASIFFWLTFVFAAIFVIVAYWVVNFYLLGFVGLLGAFTIFAFHYQYCLGDYIRETWETEIAEEQKQNEMTVRVRNALKRT